MRKAIFGIMLFMLTSSVFALTNAEGNVRICIDNICHVDDGSNLTYHESDWEMTGNYVYASGRFESTTSTANANFLPINFSQNVSVEYKVKSKDSGGTGSNAINFYFRMADNSTSNPNSSYISLDFDHDYMNLICRDMGDTLYYEQTGYNFNENSDYVVRFVKDVDDIYAWVYDNSHDLVITSNVTSCTYGGESLLQLYDATAEASFDYIYIYEHNDEDLSTLLTISVEQGTALDESLFSRELNDQASYDVIYDTVINSTVLDFDGTSTSKIGTFDIDLAKGTGFTLSTLVKSHTNSNYRYFFSSFHSGSDDIRMVINDSYFGVVFDDGSYSVNQVYDNFTTWRHLAVIQNITHLMIYLDGDLVLNATETFDYSNHDGTSMIADRHSGFGDNGNFSLDCFKLLNIPLSASEIKEEMAKCYVQQGLTNVTQQINLSVISSTGQDVEGWYANRTKISSGQTYVTNDSCLGHAICAKLDNSFWSNCYFCELEYANETEGDAAIEAGMNQALTNHIIYEDAAVAIYNGTEYTLGIYDRMAVYDDLIFPVNYVTENETAYNQSSVDDMIWLLELSYPMTASSLKDEVYKWITEKID